MRTFSSNVQTVLNGDLIRFVFLIELQFNTTYRYTSHNADVVYDGNTYIADGGLFEFDSPKFSSVVDREAYKVIISDLVGNMSAEFRYNVIGKPITVKVALMDANGDPMLSAGDIIDVYAGFVDKPTITNNLEERLAVIEGTSPMSDLDMVRSFMSSKAGMDQRSGSDTSFDEIFDDKTITVKWGKV